MKFVLETTFISLFTLSFVPAFSQPVALIETALPVASRRDAARLEDRDGGSNPREDGMPPLHAEPRVHKQKRDEFDSPYQTLSRRSPMDLETWQKSPSSPGPSESHLGANSSPRSPARSASLPSDSSLSLDHNSAAGTKAIDMPKKGNNGPGDRAHHSGDPKKPGSQSLPAHEFGGFASPSSSPQWHGKPGHDDNQGLQGMRAFKPPAQSTPSDHSNHMSIPQHDPVAVHEDGHHVGAFQPHSPLQDEKSRALHPQPHRPEPPVSKQPAGAVDTVNHPNLELSFKLPDKQHFSPPNEKHLPRLRTRTDTKAPSAGGLQSQLKRGASVDTSNENEALPNTPKTPAYSESDSIQPVLSPRPHVKPPPWRVHDQHFDKLFHDPPGNGRLHEGQILQHSPTRMRHQQHEGPHGRPENGHPAMQQHDHEEVHRNGQQRQHETAGQNGKGMHHSLTQDEREGAHRNGYPQQHEGLHTGEGLFHTIRQNEHKEEHHPMHQPEHGEAHGTALKASPAKDYTHHPQAPHMHSELAQVRGQMLSDHMKDWRQAVKHPEPQKHPEPHHPAGPHAEPQAKPPPGMSQAEFEFRERRRLKRQRQRQAKKQRQSEAAKQAPVPVKQHGGRGKPKYHLSLNPSQMQQISKHTDLNFRIGAHRDGSQRRFGSGSESSQRRRRTQRVFGAASDSLRERKEHKDLKTALRNSLYNPPKKYLGTWGSLSKNNADSARTPWYAARKGKVVVGLVGTGIALATVAEAGVAAKGYILNGQSQRSFIPIYNATAQANTARAVHDGVMTPDGKPIPPGQGPPAPPRPGGRPRKTEPGAGPPPPGGTTVQRGPSKAAAPPPPPPGHPPPPPGHPPPPAPPAGTRPHPTSASPGNGHPAAPGPGTSPGSSTPPAA